MGSFYSHSNLHRQGSKCEKLESRSTSHHSSVLTSNQNRVFTVIGILTTVFTSTITFSILPLYNSYKPCSSVPLRSRHCVYLCFPLRGADKGTYRIGYMSYTLHRYNTITACRLLDFFVVSEYSQDYILQNPYGTILPSVVAFSAAISPLSLETWASLYKGTIPEAGSANYYCPKGEITKVVRAGNRTRTLHARPPDPKFTQIPCQPLLWTIPIFYIHIGSSIWRWRWSVSITTTLVGPVFLMILAMSCVSCSAYVQHIYAVQLP